MCKYFVQILNPVNNAEILAPELISNQSEMVVKNFSHIFYANVKITGKPSYRVAKTLVAW